MEKVSNALTAIKDASVSGASTVGGFFTSTAESGVSTFKGTSLGESFFKNIIAILVVVFILLGGILYIEFASTGSGAAAPGTTGPKKEFVDRTVYIEPNTGLDDGPSAAPPGTRAPLPLPASARCKGKRGGAEEEAKRRRKRSRRRWNGLC